jgi:hypothetical protein
MRSLPSARILRFRLALAAKPGDVFFLCHVPTTVPFSVLGDVRGLGNVPLRSP